MKKIVITVLLASFIATTSCSIKNEQNAAIVEQEEIVADIQQQNEVTITIKEEDKTSEFVEIKMKIPQIKDMKNEEAQSKLNNELNSIYDLRDAIEKEAKQAATDLKKYDIPFRTYQLIADYNISYNKNGYLSLTTTVYTYTGGAHGLTAKRTYNIDIHSGKQIFLQSMFKDGLDYRGLINQEIKKQISANPDKYFTGDQGFKTITDEQNFYIEDGKIVIYFSEYEIAPYAAGIPAFELQLDHFKDSLKSEYLDI